MAHSSASQTLLGIARTFKKLNVSDPVTQCLAPRLVRTLATAVERPQSSVLTTLYSWPNLEPTRYAWYGSQYLDMPLRKDILHRAVVFEGDATRQGIASTKWRADVHGSNRKLAPQKGLGRARVGDKKSPIRRGGGVAFGPHPRDFSTDLPRKVYDIAWRTALSHRYRTGDLIVLEAAPSMPEESTPRLLHNIFTTNRWGKGHGRSLVITDDVSESFFEGMAQVGEHGEARDLDDVDVKDILKFGRVIIDTKTLNMLFALHSQDLGHKLTIEAARQGDFDGPVPKSDGAYYDSIPGPGMDSAQFVHYG